MKKIFFLLSILYLFISSGCQKSGSLSIISDSYPYYVEAYLESGRYAIVHISRTYSFSRLLSQRTYESSNADSAKEFYKKLNAHVLLLKDGIVVDSLTGPYTITYNFLKFIQGWYMRGSSHIIQPGGSYQVVIKIPQQPDILASCIVPERVDIQKLDTINAQDGYLLGAGSYKDSVHFIMDYIYQLTFSDPSAQQNYYVLEGYSINKKTTEGSGDGWNVSYFQNNPIFNNKYVASDGAPKFSPLFSDKLFNGTLKILDVKLARVASCVGDSLICLNLVSISEGYYERLKSVDLYTANQNNAYATPVEIYSNFTNAVGFLAGRTVSSDTIRMIYYSSVWSLH
jgi:hypothetical protein